jgi:putative transcriptional regulator
LTKGPPPIRNRIRELRFHAGEMTQADLAARIGMTRQTIVAMEQSKYSPSLEAAFRIADVFGVEITAVFQWDGSGTTNSDVPTR